MLRWPRCVMLGCGVLVAAVLSLAASVPAFAVAGPLDPSVKYGTFELDGREIAFHKPGGTVLSPCDYDWWHGCSATSAGMAVGHYDREGYNGATYGNLVPGGTAELSTFGMTDWSALVDPVVASTGHCNDFYSGDMTDGGTEPPGGAYKVSGDDVAKPWHSFDCLADFMGTSQDAYGNVNGATTFYYYKDGSPLTAANAVSHGIQDQSGMYGIKEYLQYCGYDEQTLYNQYIKGYGTDPSKGFTLAQYQAEIDADRPVLIQVANIDEGGHTMCGVGYDDNNPSTIYLNDTWSSGPHTMTWGGSYSGLEHVGVTVLEVVPEPATLMLLAVGGVATAWFRRRRPAA